MRTIIVGDVHGCLDELLAVLEACDGATESRVVLVGDLVAKGPDSLGVIRWARETGAQVVLGNHDDHVLTLAPDRATAADGADGKKPKKEHEKIAAKLDPEDWAWLKGLPLTLSFAAGEASRQPLTVVHGGLVPGVALEVQKRRHLLALRSITSDGQPSTRVEGVPWASLWPGPTRVVFGHDAVRGLQQHPFATGLDTGCVYGRELSALILPESRLVSVPAKRAYADL